MIVLKFAKNYEDEIRSCENPEKAIKAIKLYCKIYKYRRRYKEAKGIKKWLMDFDAKQMKIAIKNLRNEED